MPLTRTLIIIAEVSAGNAPFLNSSADSEYEVRISGDFADVSDACSLFMKAP
ncbi:hypothetical protein CAMRE0001_1357 [Campylobacter rectus RM3267]|uniref:Uncharacterized protein n=1 Tax=Campylobacter rectus RM3267 TaxID=553218 RepID=B9D043_CAMRE|nr:hypothetical protein [Campylobacter rectus]EEF14702.1 hypothetical protein CAMRE0001_1357 [Campylobacter rectus RM3267]